ncbi:MAG TPA: hypothetical protein VKZ95_00160 [Sphingobacteriaceae bacterium]|nr:hypothetical protein [Sphingobacteriaceae bacterium]
MQQSKPIFIARCSQLGKLMTNPQTKSPLDKYNEKVKQIAEGAEKYKLMKPELKTAIKLYENLAKWDEELKVLEKVKDNIHLSETAKSEVVVWMKEQLYGNYHSFSSKYTEKGNLCEADAIQFAADYYGWSSANKNSERKTNEWITGEADVVLHESIADIKNCWSEKTFPIMDTDIPIDGYGWQGLGYMGLWKKPKFQLTYCLMDAPELLVDQEARRKQYELGLDELDFELWEEVKKRMTFSHLHPDLRIKSFFIERDNSLIESAYERIEYIRKWIDQSGFYELWERTRLSA